MSVQAVSGVNSEDKRTQFLNFYSNYAASNLYTSSRLSSASGIKTDGAFNGMWWGEGYGRFSDNATGMVTGDQEAIHTFELTA